MAHQDFSEICPIFNEGVEKEMVIPCRITASISSCIGLPCGREVELVEAYFRYLTISLSTNQSCTVGIWKNTLSTQVGSIAIGESLFTSVSAEVHGFWTSASLSTQATTFTSTDLIMISMTGKGAVATPAEVVIRYKDK